MRSRWSPPPRAHGRAAEERPGTTSEHRRMIGGGGTAGPDPPNGTGNKINKTT